MLLAHLLAELRDPRTRAASVANLVALGEIAAPHLVGALAGDDADVRAAALAALRELGPRAAAVLPELYERAFTIPAVHAPALLEALAAVAPGSRDHLTWFSFSGGPECLVVGGRRLPGTMEADGMTAFFAAYQALDAATTVDRHASVGEHVAFLADSDVRLREHALVHLTQRGAEARAALPELERLLADRQPAENVMIWLENGGVRCSRRDPTPRLHRAAAQAILAIAADGDARRARARAVLGAEEGR
jgi:hypothetical protein